MQFGDATLGDALPPPDLAALDSAVVADQQLDKSGHVTSELVMNVVMPSTSPAADDTVPVPARAIQLLIVLAVTWGAVAFGAVYPWAYWPLAVGAQLAGFLGIFARRRAQAGATRQLAAALLVFAAAVLLQLLPLPVALLDSLTPATVAVLQKLELPFASGLSDSHALSIHPSSTLTGLALFGSFALLMVGTSRVLSVTGPAKLITAIVGLGVGLALAGIVQHHLFTGKIYGFWTPQLGRNPFGPFVNKNHFAGWMLMGIPLSLGLLCRSITRGMRDPKPTLRHRLLWLSSPEANRIALAAGAATVMVLSLILTMSRSGIVALAASLVLTAWFVTRGRGTVMSRFSAVLLLLAVALLGVNRVGLDVVVRRFLDSEWLAFSGRGGAWADAWSIASQFPLFGTGFNTYGFATLFYQQHELTVHYAQAHNDYLQLAAEGGILLTIPAAVCIAVFIRDIRRRFCEDAGSSAYWIRAGAVTSLIAIALQETVDFSLQMPGNAVLFATVCGITVHKTPGRRTSTPSLQALP